MDCIVRQVVLPSVPKSCTDTGIDLLPVNRSHAVMMLRHLLNIDSKGGVTPGEAGLLVELPLVGSL